LRTCRAKHRIIRVRSDSHEPKSEARCRSDIAVGIAHDNDPIELLLMLNSRAGDRDACNLLAFCSIIRERGWQSGYGNAPLHELEQRGCAPSAGRKCKRIIALLGNSRKGSRRTRDRREIPRGSARHSLSSKIRKRSRNKSSSAGSRRASEVLGETVTDNSGISPVWINVPGSIQRYTEGLEKGARETASIHFIRRG